MFANLNVRSKLALLMLLPLTGFLAYAALECRASYVSWRGMEVLGQAVDVLVRLGQSAHELQKERGLSSGFSASKGQRFATELSAQRRLSDDALAALKAKLAAATDVSAHEGFASKLQAMRQALDTLLSKRGEVDALRLAPGEVIAAYNAGIKSVLEACSGVLALSEGRGMSRPAASFVQLLHGKEIAGQERATLNGAFSVGRFTKELYRDWLFRVGAQQAYLDSFTDLGGRQASSLLADKTAGPVREVERFRKLAFDNQDKASLEADPAQWFRVSTERIDALKAVEDAWAASLEGRVAQLQAESRRGFAINLGVALGVAAITSFLGWLIFRNISQPLIAAMDFARGVTQGRLDQTMPVSRTDEIGILCRALETMLATIKEMIAKAEEATELARREAQAAGQAAREAQEAKALAENAKREGMIHAAEKLEGVVQALTATASQLAAEVEQASRGAGIQASRVGETATAMEQMNATVLEVARSASLAAKTSGEARQEAVNGSGVVREAVGGITRARDESLELKRRMGELEQRARDIGRIMGVISDIADQTNLLALNAAIEAARAGEAGRGFAVVADEVRKLAEKTMSATKEVAESIQGIQTGADETIRNVEVAVGRIEEATGLADRSGLALESIVRLVDDASLQVSSIATASEEQSAASEEINRSLEEVNRISGDTAQSMSHSAQAVEELARQAQALDRMVGELRAV